LNPNEIAKAWIDGKISPWDACALLQRHITPENVVSLTKDLPAEILEFFRESAEAWELPGENVWVGPHLAQAYKEWLRVNNQPEDDKNENQS
jgi:hypothetical protein